MTEFIEGWFTDMHKANAEIASLRAELASSNEARICYAREVGKLSAECDNLRAAARQDAEKRAQLSVRIQELEKAREDEFTRHYTERSDSCEEIARLTKVLNFIASMPELYSFELRHYDLLMEAIKEARAALACRPQPARNRPLPETRCDCCDNGLDDAWEFCPFCGQQHPDATDALACRPQGERSET